MIHTILQQARDHLATAKPELATLPLDATSLRQIKSQSNTELPNPPFSSDVWLVGINVARYLGDQTLKGNTERIHFVMGEPEGLERGCIGSLRFSIAYADLTGQYLPHDGIFYANVQEGRDRQFTELNGIVGFLAQTE